MTDIAKLIEQIEALADHLDPAAEYAEEAAMLREAATALETLQRERDEVQEALDRTNDYLRFVARWAWRESEDLTDVERLSAIKYYPPIKALADGEPAPLSPKEAGE